MTTIDSALAYLAERCDGGEIFLEHRKSGSIKTKKQEIDSFKENTSLGYGIRVLLGKRMGFYFTNTLNERALSKALKIAKVAQEDPYITLPQTKNPKPSGRKDLDIITVDEAIEAAYGMVKACSSFEGVEPTTGSVSWTTSRVEIANTHGIHGEKEDFTLGAYIGAVSKGAEPSTGFHYEVSRQKDLDPWSIGEEAGRITLESLNAKRIESGSRNVVLRPMAVAELLENTLVPSFSADNVQRGRSRLQGNVGEKLFGSLNIIDDGGLEKGLMSEPFDDEGVPTGRTVLTRDGVLEGFIYDSYTASKEGVRSTGNGSRSSYSSLPSVGPSNFLVQGDEVLNDESGAVIVHGLIGAHTANPISGDFSCETRNAFLDGVPVKKAIVSGNIFDILAGEVAFGKDPKQYSSVLSPSLELRGIIITG